MSFQCDKGERQVTVHRNFEGIEPLQQSTLVTIDEEAATTLKGLNILFLFSKIVVYDTKYNFSISVGLGTN